MTAHDKAAYGKYEIRPGITAWMQMCWVVIQEGDEHGRGESYTSKPIAEGRRDELNEALNA